MQITPTVSTAKKYEVTNQLPKDHNIAIQDPMKEDSTQHPKKETKLKTPKIKNLAWITMMTKVLAKLKKKFSIPVEKRKTSSKESPGASSTSSPKNILPCSIS